MANEFFAYVGVDPCGCRQRACVDEPKYVKETAKSLAEWVRDGCVIERVKVSDEHPLQITRCKCKSVEPQTNQAELFATT